MNKIYHFLFIILFLPIFLFSQEMPTTPIKLLIKESSKPIAQPIEEITQTIEEQINIQNKLIEDVIKNINNESFLTTLPEKNYYENEILFLNNRINANNLQNNSIAIKRDELRIAFLREKSFYENTLKDIILAKKEFKNKKYFEEILLNNIRLIQDFKLDDYTLIYENELKNNSNKVSNDFIDNYIELYNQKHTQLFVLQYLYANMQKFRSSNFFIDEFNLKYMINKIDSLKGISFLSSLTSYHLNFSVGEGVVALLIILFFRLINRYVIELIANFVSKIFIKKEIQDEESMVF